MTASEMSVLLCLLWSLVEVHSQNAPYLTFMGKTLPNNAYVDLSLLMYPGNDDTNDTSSTVICHTDLTTCCRIEVGYGRGDWYFPNGDPLPGAGSNNINQVPIAERRRDQLVRLQRGPPTATGDIPSGIYRCDIETVAVHSEDNTDGETVYVGVYESGGDITIPSGMTLTVGADLNGASPQFTLTCISTGGPATTVTWTRDSGSVVGDEMSVLDDTTTAQYTHTLTVTGRLGGLYTCTISNTKPSMASAQLCVEVHVPSGAPEMFEVAAGQRQVVFSWSPPPVALRNGVITNYTLSCSPSSSSLPQSPSQSGPLTVAGFSPDTSYSCSVVTSNCVGSGPPANITFTTQHDYLFFQLRLSGTLNSCFDVMSDDMDEKLDIISDTVLEVLTDSCIIHCGITSDIIDRQSFTCYPESPSHVTYRARLGGTSEVEVGVFISLIEKWVRDGASINVTGVQMTVATNCSVAISSLSEAECFPDTHTTTSDCNSCSDTTSATAGGVVVAVLFIIAASITIITVAFILKSRYVERSIRRAKEPDFHQEPGSEEAIAFTTNTSYITKQHCKSGEGRPEEQNYEDTDRASTKEDAYECPDHQQSPLSNGDKTEGQGYTDDMYEPVSGEN